MTNTRKRKLKGSTNKICKDRRPKTFIADIMKILQIGNLPPAALTKVEVVLEIGQIALLRNIGSL